MPPAPLPQRRQRAVNRRVVIAALYRFVKLPDFEALKGPLLQRCLDLGLSGTFLLAPEGINGAVAGRREGIDGVLRHLRADPRFADLECKESFADATPFHRMKVKTKREIVSMGVEGLDPGALAGRPVEPEAWNELIARPDTLVLDARNRYECAIGTFKNAHALPIDSFREFPAAAEQALNPGEHKRVAMFCTGGIRCEKASAHLLSKGFEEVLQLQGGILNYLKKISPEDSLWEGECFVFDGRVALNHDLEQGGYEQCFACRRPLGPADRASAKYQLGVSCPHCHDALAPLQRARFSERQRQVELAASRGEKHVGAAMK